MGWHFALPSNDTRAGACVTDGYPRLLKYVDRNFRPHFSSLGVPVGPYDPSSPKVILLALLTVTSLQGLGRDVTTDVTRHQRVASAVYVHVLVVQLFFRFLCLASDDLLIRGSYLMWETGELGASAWGTGKWQALVRTLIRTDVRKRVFV